LKEIKTPKSLRARPVGYEKEAQKLAILSRGA